MLTDKTYKIVKWITIVLMPALEALWLGMASTWGLPLAVPIGASIAIFTLFLGTIIGVSTYQYNKKKEE